MYPQNLQNQILLPKKKKKEEMICPPKNEGKLFERQNYFIEKYCLCSKKELNNSIFYKGA